jgi:outer membrane receptor for ferrienterochelin and colicins
MGSKLKPCFHALLALFLIGAAPAWGQNGTITGVVTDGPSGRGLPDTKVDAVAAGGRVAASTFTNSAGRYALSVPAGTYDVTVESLGYEPARSTNVVVSAGGSARADVVLQIRPFQLNPVSATASTTTSSSLNAPASVAVISERDIQARPAITPTDYLRATPGVDVITQGVQSTNVVARGFNNIFSGSLHMITDNRLAGVPSLRVNVLHFVPTTTEDLQRMEVVLGPAAALYGPNTAAGVLHMITKSPLVQTGTSASITGGERDVLMGTLRTAHRLSDRFGFKLSGSLMRADEWSYVDPDEVAERAKFDADPFFRQEMIASLGITPEEADRRIATIGNRSYDIERLSGEARVDFQATEDATITVQSGLTNVGSGIELTGLGAAQVDDWRYMYYQGRLNWNRLFAQVYLNQSNAGDTYLLRTGQPIVDESTLLVGQIRHGFSLSPRQVFTYGADYFRTNPQTNGTINGIYEDEDKTDEIGAYLQSETALHPKFDLVLAGRVDDHSALPDLVFSPRAALVFKPTEDQAFRATYNRAFSTPTSLNQFLDLPTSVPNQATDPTAAGAARLGYSVRVQGTGTEGFQFRQPDGTYLMRSPFTPAGMGGPAQLLPANVAAFYPAAVQVFAAQGGCTQVGAAVCGALQSFNPAGVSTNFIVGDQSIPIAALTLEGVAPIRETTTTTYEVGYKGILQERFSLSADVWFSQIDDFVTPLTVSTPLLALNGQTLVQGLVPHFMATLGMDQATATATATAIAPNLARVPLGVISSAQVNATGAQLLATYTNVPESLDLYGADVALQTLITPSWSVTLGASIVSDDHFESEQVGTVTLNAPKRKGSLALEYRGETNGLTGEVRARYNDKFPVKSGVYEATACIDDDTTALPCVDSYTLMDLSVGYSIPQLRGTSVQLSVQNVFDEEYRSFPGVPNVGRLALLRLRYEF